MALAVYAPIPEPEQGRALAFRLSGSVSHDSNLFGAPTNAIESFVFSVRPSLAYNNSLSDQTFLSLGYELSLEHMPDRPTKQDLASHTLRGRLAHQFSTASSIDLSDDYEVAENPQSLLAGVPLNTDQSYRRNELNARYVTTAGRKLGLVLKYRNADTAYDNANLAAQLDRLEQLLGVEGSLAFLPETKLIGEYRFQTIAYDTTGALKDKRSHFALGGVDYAAGEKWVLSVRGGAEDRVRDGEQDTTAPYAELSARYAYAKDSFLAGGYAHALEEPSDVMRFTDTRVNRFFANVQHRISALIAVSSSVTYEPSVLQGRRGVADVDERVLRIGLGVTWALRPSASLALTYDVDQIDSDDAARDQSRQRTGLSMRVVF
jgi:hypothetical protein